MTKGIEYFIYNCYASLPMGRGILALLLLLFLPLVFAQSSNTILEYGYTSLHLNQEELNADYENEGSLRFDSDAPPGWYPHHNELPVIAGDFDGDGIPEFPFNVNDEVHLYHYDGESISVAYTNLHNGANTFKVEQATQMFADIDGDGDDEYFACGARGGGAASVAGYDYNKSTGLPYLLWETNLSGDNTVCAPEGPTLIGTSYAPTTYTLDGHQYILFVQDFGGAGEVRFVRVHALNGSFTLSFEVNSSGCTTLKAPGALSGTVTARGDSVKSGERNAYMKTTVCPDPSDPTNKIAYLVVDCDKATDERGLYAFDLRTFQTQFTFGTSGFDPLGTGNVGNLVSSPSCFQKSGGSRLATLSYEDGSGTVDIQEADANGLSSLDSVTFPTDYDYITDMWQGEFSSPTSENFDDVCVMAQDYETGDVHVFCTDIDDPLLADEVKATRFGPGAGFNNITIRAQVTTHTPESDLSGDSRDEVVTNLGIFSIVPDPGALGYTFQADDFDPIGLSGEGFAHIDNTWDYIQGTCGVLDFNNDSFADVFCWGNNNITYFLSASEIDNAPPEYTGRETAPVLSRCITGASCTIPVNSTLTYNLSFSDVNDDPLYFAFDCDTRFSPGPTALNVTNFSVTFTCEYQNTGNTLTRIYGNDDPDYTLFKDINVTITQESGLLCDFDGIFEPLEGETQENCLPDFQAAQSFEEANATASEEAQQAERASLLASVGVNTTQSLFDVTVINGIVQKQGTMEDLKEFIWTLFSYLVAIFPYLLAMGLLLGAIAYFFGGAKR